MSRARDTSHDHARVKVGRLDRPLLSAFFRRRPLTPEESAMEGQAEGVSCVLALLEVAPMPAGRPLLCLAPAPDFRGSTRPLGRIPDAHAVVPAAGGQPPAVRAPGDLRVEAG